MKPPALRDLLLISGLALGLVPTGCNIVAPAYLLVHGPEKVTKAFTLDPARPTVILVDTATTNPIRPAVRAAIAEQVGRDLMAHAGLKTVVDARSAQSMASLDRYGNQMPVSEIGRAVNAQVVIHVMVESLGLTPDGQTYIPSASLRVKVIDAENERRLFPEDGEGQPVTLTRKITTNTLPERGANWTNAELEFARYTGTAIAQLFYDHERTDSHLLGR